MPIIRCARRAKTCTSFHAWRIESSEVDIRPPEINLSWLSVSFCSGLGGIIVLTTRSRAGTNQIRIIVFVTLNAVWKVARTAFSLSGDTSDGTPGVKSTPHSRHTPPTNQRKTHSTHTTPNRLNTRCARAARRACTEAESATTLEVLVVPIFSPSTSAIPISTGSTWVEQSVIVIAMIAAELCTAKVSIPPTNR